MPVMDNCTNGTYTTPNGLEFEKKCGFDTSAEVLFEPQKWGLTVESIEDCMDECSMAYGGICGAASYNLVKKECSLKKAGKESRDINGTFEDRDVIIAFTNKAQVQPLNMDCPGNGTEMYTKNGMPYTVLCETSYNQDDVDFTNKVARRIHTSTLEECMEECSTGQPLCLGVLWNGNQNNGFPNCYPKGGNFDEKMLSRDNQSQSALVPKQPSNFTCANDLNHVKENKTFHVACQKSGSGEDVARSHESGIEDCVNKCATYKPQNATSPDCTGVLYDVTMKTGWENCYLKQAMNDISSDPDYSIALLADGGSDGALGGVVPTNTPTGGPSAGQNSGGGRDVKVPAIVGSVVGAFALLAMVVMAILFTRRRKQQRSESRSQLTISHPMPPQPYSTASSSPVNMTQSPISDSRYATYQGARSELDSGERTYPVDRTRIMEFEAEFKRPLEPYELESPEVAELDGNDKKK